MLGVFCRQVALMLKARIRTLFVSSSLLDLIAAFFESFEVANLCAPTVTPRA